MYQRFSTLSSLKKRPGAPPLSAARGGGHYDLEAGLCRWLVTRVFCAVAPVCNRCLLPPTRIRTTLHMPLFNQF